MAKALIHHKRLLKVYTLLRNNGKTIRGPSGAPAARTGKTGRGVWAVDERAAGIPGKGARLMYSGIHNFSEIGKLNKVLLHRPGEELE